MNGLHLCRDCNESFELDELNWNVQSDIGRCLSCMLKKYALRVFYVACHDCGKRFQPELTEEFLLTGKAVCTDCSSFTRT